MLIRFSVTNHASLRERQELTMVAQDRHPTLAVRAIPGARNAAVLPVAGIYGSNASGKSNFINAIAFMRSAVLHSHQRWLPEQRIPRQPFLFDNDSRNEPSVFELEFTAQDVRYRYGFACTDYAVIEEWLYSYPTAKQRLLFHRETGSPIRFGPSLSGPKKTVEGMTRPNSLFMSTAAATNFEALLPVYTWFQHRLMIETDANLPFRLEATLHEIEHHHRSSHVQLLLRYADLGVTGMRLVERQLPEEVRNKFEQVLHALEIDLTEAVIPQAIEVQHRYNGAEHSLPFENESSGTKTWLGILGPIMAALRTGAVLVVDEINASLHPHIVGQFVRLFQDTKSNPKGAQLIFNSHDVTLLSRTTAAHLRRDQVWLTEKHPQTGSSRLYPLTDYYVRDNRDHVDTAYLLGRFGGVPYLDESLIDDLAAEFDTGTD